MDRQKEYIQGLFCLTEDQELESIISITVDYSNAVEEHNKNEYELIIDEDVPEAIKKIEER